MEGGEEGGAVDEVIEATGNGGGEMKPGCEKMTDLCEGWRRGFALPRWRFPG